MFINIVELSPEEAELLSGMTLQLNATVFPTGVYIEDRTVTWSSSDESVTTVSETGLVTYVAEGTATITVITEDGEHTATCVVTVSEHLAVDEMTFHPLTFGETYNINLGGDSQIVELIPGSIKNMIGYAVDLEFGEGGIFTVTAGPEPAASDTIMYILNENLEQVVFANDSGSSAHPSVKFIP